MIHDAIVDAALILRGCTTRRRADEQVPAILSRLSSLKAALGRLPPIRRPRVTGPLASIKDACSDPAVVLSPDERASILALADAIEELATPRRRILRAD